MLWCAVCGSPVRLDELHGFEYWTDGWRDGSLMPNDEGLRHCKCGRFVLMKDLVQIETAETSDLPYIEHVPDELLPECIAKAESEDMVNRPGIPGGCLV